MDRVDVTYTLGDLYAVTMQTWQRPLLRILILVGVLVAGLVALAMALDGLSLWESIGWFHWGLYLGLTAFLLLFIYGACPLISYRRLKRRGELGPNRFTFLGEGVQVESPKAQSLVYWSGLNRVSSTRDRLFLFVGPALAFVLPSRAFNDAHAFEAAIGEARSRWTASRQ